jgi:tetratricopeptide (TPR) repeat protein
VWQSLLDEFGTDRLRVIAVAIDRPEAARPWIEAAHPTYPCLIDADHFLTDLYNLVNVPQSVWIDETGRMARPPGSAGSSDGFREMDRVTGAMPESVAAERTRAKHAFVDAVRDWVRHGAASRHAMTPEQVAQRLRRPDPAIAEAHALFRLGQHLLDRGQEDEALDYWRRATELHPESWTMYRQNATKNATGLATSPEFWARVDALGDKPYHLPFD